MRRNFLAIASSLFVFLHCFGNLDAMAPVQTPSDAKDDLVADGMKCDGTTDDTAALQGAILAARKSAGHLILPRGTCLVSSAISIPDHVWIQGRGKQSTTIRRKDRLNVATDMFDLSGEGSNVTITDITIDGNKDGDSIAGQYSLGAAGAQAVGVSKLTILRTRWLNAYQAAIGLFVNPGQFVADTVIADSEFENNGKSTTFTADQIGDAGDVAIRSPLRVKVLRNRSANARGNFVCFGTNANIGVGDVVVSGNTVQNATGFGIALGVVGRLPRARLSATTSSISLWPGKIILTLRSGPM